MVVCEEEWLVLWPLPPPFANAAEGVIVMTAAAASIAAFLTTLLMVGVGVGTFIATAAGMRGVRCWRRGWVSGLTEKAELEAKSAKTTALITSQKSHR